MSIDLMSIQFWEALLIFVDICVVYILLNLLQYVAMYFFIYKTKITTERNKKWHQ